MSGLRVFCRLFQATALSEPARAAGIRVADAADVPVPETVLPENPFFQKENIIIFIFIN
ncbi:hypothetical protein [Methanoculleus sp. MH98A]|uniref:hypothetical protein n=1 Tax=Methanoculleus sp. MH98A TaxID=1495314 RepID=UPI0012DC5BE3|nr:hypothetical protein [Methanoculleus sp. MH98A]